jgi:hypothetical protein
MRSSARAATFPSLQEVEKEHKPPLYVSPASCCNVHARRATRGHKEVLLPMQQHDAFVYVRPTGKHVPTRVPDVLNHRSMIGHQVRRWQGRLSR